MSTNINIKLTRSKALPIYGKPGDAGADLRVMGTITIIPGGTKMFSTGVSVEIPEGHFGMVVPRSSTGKLGLQLINTVGIIDSGYRGEIILGLVNNSTKVVHIHDLHRVCQLVIVPFVKANFIEVSDLSETERGTGGFGSTGK